MHTDPRVRAFRLPTRVVWQTAGEAVSGSEVLLRQNVGQALAQPAPHCLLRHRGEAPSLLLDFGRELHGGVQLVTNLSPPQQGNRPVRVRLRFGESVSEAMGQPNNDHVMHDLVVSLPPMGAQEFGLTGFRFVRIDLLDQGDELQLAAVRAVTLMRPSPRLGWFKCSDDRLNRIWEVGADTVHLCMQDYVWDGIKRDRLVWLGDLHPEVCVISTVFGADPVVPASLDWARDHTPLPAWMNGISSYSMWWVLIHRDWYRHHGDRAYLAQQGEYLDGLLRQLCSAVRDDGFDLGGWLFLDWATNDKPEAVRAGLHALLHLALTAGAELCGLLARPATASLCRQQATRLAARPPALRPESKQASALLALAGLHPAQAANQTVLAHEPLRGLSTFYGYYVLQARAAAGDIDGCLEVIRRYWGTMLDLGATSFWEHFDLSWAENAGRIDELLPPAHRDLHAERGEYCYQGWRHSLCHGWAAGPTAWLSEHVLGFSPAAPGGAKVRLAPHLGDLAWAEGAWPTPQGVVTVRHERAADRTVRSDVQAPAGVAVVR